MKHVAEVADEGVVEEGLDSDHDNLQRELEMSLLLDYRLYLWMFPFAFGELLEMSMPLIRKEDMIMTDLCNTSLQIVHFSRFIKLYCINCSNVYGLLPKSNCNMIPEWHLFMA